MATTAKFKIESGVQLLARLCKKPEVANFFQTLFEPGLKQGDTVEIFSYVNISYLLIDIMSAALLPNNGDEEPTGVLFINTLGKFNYDEFVEILKRKIQDHLQNNQTIHMENYQFEEMLHKTLSNFHFIEIYDVTQFYTTIHNLDSILMKHSNISLLIFDSLIAFYWSEQGFKITKMDLYIKLLLTMIQKLSREYKIILMYTRPTYFSSIKDGDSFESSELSDNINFKVQVVHNNSNSFYGVNVKTSQTYYKKCYNIINNIIYWK